MKFCLSSIQSESLLKKADEIVCEYKYKEHFIYLHELYPEKPIIVRISLYDIMSVNWEEILMWNDLHPSFILCTPTIELCKEARSLHIKSYLNFAVTSFYQLKAVMNMDVEYILIDAPLFFQLDKVKKLTGNKKLRLIPNYAYNDGFTRSDGIHGTWVRPEDLEVYEKYFDVCEFNEDNVEREAALYRIYAEEKTWKGHLNTVVENLDVSGYNAMLLSEKTLHRLNCGHRCQDPDKSCHYCDNLFSLAHPELFREYSKFVLNKDLSN